jgi:hypothetical protein
MWILTRSAVFEGIDLPNYVEVLAGILTWKYYSCVMSLEVLNPRLSLWHAIVFCKDFYCWAQAAVFNTADKILNSTVTIPDERACSAALRLMFQILSWNFKHTVEHESSDAKINSGLRIDTINLKKFERSLVKVYPNYLHVCSISVYNVCIFYCSQGLCGERF